MPEGQLVTQGISDSDIDVSTRQLRIFLANRAIAVGWALKVFCKPCAYRLFSIARWLVPEVQRFFLQRTGSQNRNHRRIVEFAVDLGALLSRIQPLGVVGGLVIVLVLLGSLDLALRASTTDTQPLVENFAFQHEPQVRSGSRVLSVSKSSETMQGFVSETGSISGAQIAPVPLPLRKPERILQSPERKGRKPSRSKKNGSAKKSAGETYALSAIPYSNLVGVGFGRRHPRHRMPEKPDLFKEELDQLSDQEIEVASCRCGLGR